MHTKPYQNVTRRNRSILISLVLLGFMSWAGWDAGAQEKEEVSLVKNGDFEQGIVGWVAYEKKEPKSVLSQSTDPYDGRFSLKVETPGTGQLEGAYTVVGELVPNNRYHISAYVWGEGKVLLCAYDNNRWTYGRETTLSNSWQRLEIDKVIKQNAVSLYIITSGPTAQKVTFLIDKVEVVNTTEETLSVPWADVAPVCCEAEDYKGKNVKVTRDSSVKSGAYVAGTRWYDLMDRVPFPQTGKPVYIYAKGWISGDIDKNYLGVYLIKEGGREELGKKYFSTPQEWVWIRFDVPFSYLEVGKEFVIRHNGSAENCLVKLDGIVMATDGNLTDRELENAR